jgi:hypothetical protein
MAQPLEKVVQVGERNTRYLEAGQGEPVILLHPAFPGAHGGLDYRYTIGPRIGPTNFRNRVFMALVA